MTGPAYNQYLAVPKSGSGAGVLVLHPWWGLNDVIRDFCDRLAAAGYVALAPDMFSGRLARTVPEAEQLVAQMSEARIVTPIILSAAEELNRRAPGGLGTIGFSFGGFWALWLSERRPDLIRAAAIFYATYDGDFKQSGAAYLCHFAETDPFESSEGIALLEKNLKAADRPAALHTYPGTGHWFVEKDRPEAYDATAAELAWERTLAFLHDQLGSARR